MRAMIVLALVACNKDKPKAAPAPVAVPADAAVDAASPDAAPSTPVISPNGIGKLQRLAWDKQDEEATATLIANALSPDLAGITVKFSVLDVPGEVEREEGYWAVKRGETEVIQVLRVSGEPNGPAAMIAWTADVATADGVKVGDPLSRVLAKHADLACTNDAENLIVDTVQADLQCTTGDGLVYLLDPNKQKIKGGKPAAAKLAAIPIVGIASIPRSP